MVRDGLEGDGKVRCIPCSPIVQSRGDGIGVKGVRRDTLVCQLECIWQLEDDGVEADGNGVL